MEWVSAPQLAEAAQISPQKARAALAKVCAGKASRWRGAALNVRKVKGRGGAAGVRYEVQVESLPKPLQARFEAGSKALAAPGAGSAASAKRTILFNLIADILQFEKGSQARARAIDAATQVAIFDPVSGAVKKLSKRTLQRHLLKYEADGFAGLGRLKRADAGESRVVVSARWDKSVPVEDAIKEGVAKKLKDYVRAQHKNHESLANIRFKAELKLEQWTKELGFDLPKGVCEVPHAFVKAESKYRKVWDSKRDRKTFEDNRPAVRRSRDGMEPMDVIVGDVHHLDFVLPEIEGFQRYAKAIAWLDIATNRIWMTIIVLPKGQGVRNEHVITSFIEMVTAWGLPKQLYLDNGSEYNWAAFIEDAMKLAGVGGERCIVRAKPYNARSKPIEGIFGLLEQNHFRKLPGWIGGDRMKSKRANVGQAPVPFPGNHDSFREAIKDAVKIYHHLPQCGSLNKRSPFAVFNAFVDAGWQQTAVDEDAFLTAFSTEEVRTVKQHCIEVDGRIWSCDELRCYFGNRVTVLIPKYSQWARLPVKDDRGRLLCFAEPDATFGFQDVAGARESARRGKIRNVAIRDLDASAPTINPLAETRELAASLPGPLTAPIGARLTASDEQRQITAGIKETPKQRRERENAALEREHEERRAVNALILENNRKGAA